MPALTGQPQGLPLQQLQEDLKLVETDSIIASIIARSRMTEEGQKLIIAIETDWIPGINDKTDRGYGSNHQAINPLLRELDSLGDTLKKIGLVDIEIIQESSRDIEANAVLVKGCRYQYIHEEYSDPGLKHHNRPDHIGRHIP